MPSLPSVCGTEANAPCIDREVQQASSFPLGHVAPQSSWTQTWAFWPSAQLPPQAHRRPELGPGDPHRPSIPHPDPASPSPSQNVTANHRISDAVANEDGPQVLTGRFMYGPLDMVTLTGEKVRTRGDGGSPCLPPCGWGWGWEARARPTRDQPARLQVDVHIMTQPPSGEWLYLDTLVTNSSGRVSYTIPETHRLGVGVYPVKMVVRYAPHGTGRRVGGLLWDRGRGAGEC